MEGVVYAGCSQCTSSIQFDETVLLCSNCMLPCVRSYAFDAASIVVAYVCQLFGMEMEMEEVGDVVRDSQQSIGPSRRRMSRGDDVVGCSLVPFIPRRHRLLRTVVAAVPTVSPQLLPPSSTDDEGWVVGLVREEQRRNARRAWIVDCGILPAPWPSAAQCILQAALRQHWVAVLQGRWAPQAGVATVVFSDDSIGCTRDVDGLAKELCVRARFQLLVPPSDLDLPLDADSSHGSSSSCGIRLVTPRTIQRLAQEHLPSANAKRCNGDVARGADSFERRACFATLVRLRMGSEPAPSPPQPFRVTFVRPSDRRCVVQALRGNESCNAEDPWALLDAALLFCVEREDNPNTATLHTISELLPRLGKDVATTTDELWTKTFTAMGTLTTQRLLTMYEIGRIERNASLRVELAKHTVRRLQWYGTVPSPTDVIKSMAGLEEWVDTAGRVLIERQLPDWDRVEVAFLNQSNVIAHLALQRDGPEGEQCLDVVKQFVSRHGRTMRAPELKGLMPR